MIEIQIFKFKLQKMREFWFQKLQMMMADKDQKEFKCGRDQAASPINSNSSTRQKTHQEEGKTWEFLSGSSEKLLNKLPSLDPQNSIKFSLVFSLVLLKNINSAQKFSRFCEFGLIQV